MTPTATVQEVTTQLLLKQDWTQPAQPAQQRCSAELEPTTYQESYEPGNQQEVMGENIDGT